METLMKLNEKTAGRDKIARLLQYGTRVCWSNLQPNRSQDIDYLKDLEYTLSSFRKLLRFGRCFDTFYSTFSVIHNPDIVLRVTVSMSKICSALFLLADHMIWLSRAGLRKVDSQKWNRISNRYWLYSIIMSLIRDIYEIIRVLNNNKNRILSSGVRKSCNILPVTCQAFKVISLHKQVCVDIVKNVCDFWIPLNAIGLVKLSPRTIGVLGVVSSIAGLITIIDPLTKLTPS